jgi:DNA-binding response OmpR family regulator
MLELRNRLSTLAREKLALYTTGRAFSMDELLRYLWSVDRELYPRTASVHVTKGYGEICSLAA